MTGWRIKSRRPLPTPRGHYGLVERLLTPATSGTQISPLYLYGCGVFGSVAAELVALLRETQRLGGAVPPLYKKPFYICVRVLVAVIAAGGLPVLLDATNFQNAFYIGLSAPLLLDRLQRSLQTEVEHAKP